MITAVELKALAANKALSIGEAWNALEEAADAIKRLEYRLVYIGENISDKTAIRFSLIADDWEIDRAMINEPIKLTGTDGKLVEENRTEK